MKKTLILLTLIPFMAAADAKSCKQPDDGDEPLECEIRSVEPGWLEQIADLLKKAIFGGEG